VETLFVKNDEVENINEIEEALRIVENAGFTVIDDRRLRAYYKQHETRLEVLVSRAIAGDPFAGEELLRRYIGSRPVHIAYSASLIKFMGFISSALLSRRAITTATKPSKRLNNPLLAAVLKTNSRKDYVLADRKRQLKALFDIHISHGNHKYFIRGKGVSEKDALIEDIASRENLTKEQLKKYLSTPKT